MGNSLNQYFTIREFNKRLKRWSVTIIFMSYFTIREFNKRLKLTGSGVFSGSNFTIREFNKRLKPNTCLQNVYGRFYHKRI